jgi:hypothetical protein
VSSLAGVILCGGRRAAVQLAPVDYHERYRWCCYAAANDGPAACTCWEPIFDMEQLPPRIGLEPETRTRQCGDCAYKPDSPERQADPCALLDLENFWCHRGIRRPTSWQHLDGRVRPGSEADYQPPIVDGVPYRADGRPAARCAGWAALQETA